MIASFILLGVIVAIVLPLLLTVQLRELRSEMLQLRQRLAELEARAGAASRETTSTPMPVAVPPSTSQRSAAAASAANSGETRWERFFGAKLFAWLGGVAAFLGATFFLKYSFEHNFIPPVLRVTTGFAFGAALIAAGIFARPRAYAVTAQTLIGTGVVVLYAAAFAAHTYYHLPAFGLLVTFATMALVTFAAIFLAVQRMAPAIAVLGLVGGFLTPALLATADLQPVPLFGYVAVLNAGLIAIVVRRGWTFLPPLACIGTVLVCGFWAVRYFARDEAATAAIVVSLFCAEFLAGRWLVSDNAPGASALTNSTLGAAVLAFVASLFLLWHPLVAERAFVVFGPTLAATVTLLAICWRAPTAKTSWLPVAALLATAVVECSWQTQWGDSEPQTHLAIYLGWILPFYLCPFIARERFLRVPGPWVASAFAPAVQFFFVYELERRRLANPGVIPIAMGLIPLCALYFVTRLRFRDPPGGRARVAWYAASALLFAALVAPTQFHHQWITLAWAIEGAALLWLYRLIALPVIATAGVTLLLAAFMRFALNPGVLEYHQRGPVGFWNWYLYAYGIVIAALFIGARLSDPAALYLRTTPNRRLLSAAATTLLFILMNIEIADYFVPPGTRVLTFEFAGNFARDMSYTIGWSVFALALLLVGIRIHSAAARRAAVCVLGVALLKLFLHDLAELEALYRIVALFAVAAIAIAASIAYQRFVPDETER